MKKASSKRAPAAPPVTQPAPVPSLTPEQAGEIAAGIWLTATPETSPAVFQSEEWHALCRRQYELFSEWKANKPLTPPQVKNDIGEPFFEVYHAALLADAELNSTEEPTPPAISEAWEAATENAQEKTEAVFAFVNSLARKAFEMGRQEERRQAAASQPSASSSTAAQDGPRPLLACDYDPAFDAAMKQYCAAHVETGKAKQGSPAFRAAVQTADAASDALREVIDGLLLRAYQGGKSGLAPITQEEAEAADIAAEEGTPAQPAHDAPQEAQEAQGEEEETFAGFLHEALTESGFHENLSALLIAAGDGALYYRDNVKTLEDEKSRGYQAVVTMQATLRKIVRATVGSFGIRMYLAGMEAGK